jgi:hypothetical protein
MASKYSWGVRTTAHNDAWVQTGFTRAQALAEAERLNAEPYGFGPYVAASTLDGSTPCMVTNGSYGCLLQSGHTGPHYGKTTAGNVRSYTFADKYSPLKFR